MDQEEIIDPRLRADPKPSYPPPPRPSFGPTPATPIAPNVQSYDQPRPTLYPSPATPGLGFANAGPQDHDGLQVTPDDTKRSRACEACRGLKVRCEFDPPNSEGPCKRCTKANRNCVITAPSRKRQKKSDSRVAELEKKIDALTATLQASRGAPHPPPPPPRIENNREHDGLSGGGRSNPYEQVTNGSYGTGFDNLSESRRSTLASDTESRKASAPPMVIAGQKRKYQPSAEMGTPASATSAGSGKGYTFDRTPSGQSRHDAMIDKPSTMRTQSSHEYADVIDRGLLSMESATNMFTYYVEMMAPHLPAVVFPAGTSASEVRRSKTILFLAILSVAAGKDHADLQKILIKEVMQIYADRIVCHGEKSLELIQALTVTTLWYWPPEHFEELKFYQLVHMAAVMAMDIGLGRRNKPRKGRSTANVTGLWRDHPWKRNPPPDPDAPESRRTWISCYFMCAATAMGLRRPNLLRWTPYMAECVEFLEKSPDAAPSDRLFAQWVRSQRIAEEVSEQFLMDDSDAIISISDPKIQYALKGFERDLKNWRDQVPKEFQIPTLKLTEHVVNLYMHEIALHVDHNVDEFKPPYIEAGLRSGIAGRDENVTLTSAHIAALSTCLTSIDGIFEAFLSMDIQTIRSLPVVMFVRTGYAVVVLVKMYFAASTPNSDFGKVIDKDNMKVEQYLDGLLEKFKETAADDKSRTASKFLMVLVMLKTWFHRSKSGKLPFPAARPATAEGQTPAYATDSDAARPALSPPAHETQSKIVYSPANTPLQLLSEVATSGNPVQSSSEWSNGGQQYSSVDQSFGCQILPFDMNMNSGLYGNIDPALGGVTDFDFTTPEGFEQAMGMTLGEGMFANYFSDDSFLGAMMDSVQGPVFEGN